MIKNRLNYLLLLLTVGLITLSSCEKDDDVNVMPDQEFMNFAAVSSLFEIQSSQLATQKATTQQVTDFANHMITDHTVQSDELKALATRKNITLPQTLTQDKQTIVNRLNGLTGSAFEKDYINAQVQSHQETVANFEKASNEAKDADIKAFAAKYLPALRMHLQEAQSTKAVTDAL